jgi:hypothetical protein
VLLRETLGRREPARGSGCDPPAAAEPLAETPLAVRFSRLAVRSKPSPSGCCCVLLLPPLLQAAHPLLPLLLLLLRTADWNNFHLLLL